MEQDLILKKISIFNFKIFFTFSDSRSLAAATQLTQDSGNRDLIGRKGMSLKESIGKQLFAFASMEVSLGDRQCQLLLPRLSA